MKIEEKILTLTRLGLTTNQAKAYFALTQSDSATAKEISAVSKITRQDVYRLMPTLLNIGIIEKEITNPVMFTAVQLEQAVSILLQRKLKDDSAIRKRIVELLRDNRNTTVKKTPHEEKSQFFLIPGQEAGIIRRKKEIEQTCKNIDVINTWKRFPKTLSIYAKEIKKALRRGVEIRHIAEKPDWAVSIPEEIPEFRKVGNIKFRFILYPPPAMMAIYDKKVVIVPTSLTTGVEQCPLLWTNNPSVATACQDYFERMWDTINSASNYKTSSPQQILEKV